MNWAETYMKLNFHPGAMLVFGVFLLCGVLGGIIANRISWLPTISSFMALGFIIGPHGLSFVTDEMLRESSILTTIAMGLILYKLGNTLHPKEMLYSKTLKWMSFSENFFSFTFIFLLVIAFGHSIAHAWIVAAICMSSSPAVLVHVASEMRAKGPVTKRCKSLIALNNILSYALFSFGLPFAMGKNDSINTIHTFIYTGYRFIGATIAGIVVAWLSVKLARMLKQHDEHYRFSIVIGSITLVLGICDMFGISVLLAPLVLGIATRWFETSRHNLSSVTIGEGGDLFFIILFVFAGAKLDVGVLATAGLLPVLLVIARVLGKSAGVYFTIRALKLDTEKAGPISLLLIPMASMAIGLVLTASSLIPDMGRSISTVIFSMIVILETLGPIAAKEAFLISGEAYQENEET